RVLFRSPEGGTTNVGPDASFLPLQCDAHQADDDFVGEGVDGEGFQIFGGIERERQDGGGAAGDFAAFAFEGGEVEDADFAGAQIDARRERFVAAEGEIVDEI